MDSNGSNLKSVLGDFLCYYAQRDKNMEFSEWLGSAIREKLPALSADDGAALAQEITDAVSAFDRSLSEIDTAFESGVSKEEWLTEKITENCAKLPPDTAGERLLKLEDSFSTANVKLINGIDETQTVEAVPASADPAGWNEYTLKNKAQSVSKQIAFAGLSIAANAAKYKLESGDAVGLRDAVGEALKDGLKSDPSEVKAAVAGAVKVAAMNGLTDLLPEDTPTDLIGDMAGAAVEGARAMLDAANGNITMTEAMDKVGRAGVAVGCKAGAEFLRGKLLNLPFGPIIVDLLGGLLDHMESSVFFENVYTTVKNTAIATWEGIKESNTVGALKQAKEKLFN